MCSCNSIRKPKETHELFAHHGASQRFRPLCIYCELLGLVEISRYDSEGGRFTNIFLAAPGDVERAKSDKAPVIELTYNWDPKDYPKPGRAFGHLVPRRGHLRHLPASDGQWRDDLRPPRDGYMAFIRCLTASALNCFRRAMRWHPKPWASMGNTGDW